MYFYLFPFLSFLALFLPIIALPSRAEIAIKNHVRPNDSENKYHRLKEFQNGEFENSPLLQNTTEPNLMEYYKLSLNPSQILPQFLSLLAAFSILLQ